MKNAPKIVGLLALIAAFISCTPQQLPKEEPVGIIHQLYYTGDDQSVEPDNERDY